MKTRSDNRELYWQAILFGSPLIMLLVGSFVFAVSAGGIAWDLIYCLALGFVVIGGVYVVRAKWPNYRAGKFFSFGVRGLAERSRQLYSKGWKLIALGTGLALGLLLTIWL